MNKYELIKEKITKDILIEDYINLGLSKDDICHKEGICNSTLNKLLNDYGLSRDNKAVKGKAQQGRFDKRFQDLLETLPSRDELYKEYIEEDCEYEQLLKKYNLTSWTLDKVIKHYDLKKTRKQSASKVLQTKIAKYGVDNVTNWKKGHETRIKNAGSLKESYRLGTITNQETCLERYGVKCIYQRDDYNAKKKDTKPNLHFKQLLEDNNINDYQREFNIDLKSFDFKIGSNLIEINPTITHNSTYGFIKSEPLDKKYHFEKSKLARDNGYRCIHVWDWDDENKIIRMLLPRPSVYARKCEIREVDKKTAKDFINAYHLQGYAKDNIRVGLFYDNQLVSIMTFDKPRYNKNFEYELVRYCASYNVIGGAEKIFKYFINTYNPASIISYCDYSKFSGDTYIKLGFTFKTVSIGRHWYNVSTDTHITDNFLRQRGFDQLFGTNYGKGVSNNQLMVEHGFVEIYDAGQATFTWLNK